MTRLYRHEPAHEALAGPVPSLLTAAESAALAQALVDLQDAENSWLLVNAAQFEIVRLSPPRDCVCGTPLYRHSMALGGYRAACISPGRTE